MEEWRTIEGYPNYMVSNLGRVKSLGNDKNRKEKILKSCKDGCGYLFIRLNKEGKVKTFKTHRLVAKAFIPNPNNLPEINHIDEDKTNNRVDNLEWCNRKYNCNYGTRTEKISKPILQFSLDSEFIKKWNSTMEAQRELGIYHSHITNCCKQKYGFKTAGNYKWGYEKDYKKIPFKVFDLEIYKKIA